MAYYLSKPNPKFYYDKIKAAESLKTGVDNFWNNTLPHYFSPVKLYGIEQEQRLQDVVKQRADFTIRCIRKGGLKKVVLMEDKRSGHESQKAKWTDAREQLMSYLGLVRTEQGDKDILYGAVTIGTYVRFYYFLPAEQGMQDYPSPETGKAYELELEEADVHQILNEFVTKTSHCVYFAKYGGIIFDIGRNCGVEGSATVESRVTRNSRVNISDPSSSSLFWAP